MGRKNSSDVDAALAAEGQSDTGKPLVEMRNNRPLGLVAYKLRFELV